jgi:hypothetical protein
MIYCPLLNRPVELLKFADDREDPRMAGAREIRHYN